MDTDDKGISIRRATADDTVLISVLAAATFYEAYFEQDESANLAGYINEAFSPTAIAAEIADPASTFFIIFQNGMAVGYARLIDGSRTDGVADGRVVELKRLYILERMWGKGVGGTLLEYCIRVAAAHGYNSIWLGVWEENPRARAFYEKYGFEQVGTLNVPYGDVVGTNLIVEKRL